MSDDNQDPYKTVNNDGAYSGSEYNSTPTQYAGNQGYQPDARTQYAGNQDYQPDARTQVAGNNGYQNNDQTQVAGNYGYQPDGRTQVAGNHGAYDTDSLMDAEEPCPPIHGWLLFFLFVFVGLGSIVSMIMDLVDYDFSSPAFITAGIIISDLAYLATAAFTIVAFYKRHTDAVYLARIFVVACFVINLGALIISSDELSSNEVTTCIKSIIWCGIWFIFTFASQQIKERIPEDTRQFKIRDFVLGGLILFPILAIVLYGSIAMHQQQVNAQNDAEKLSTILKSISDKQNSDGRILITLPDGVTCDKKTDEDGMTLFNLSIQDEGTVGFLVSEHDNTVDKASVEEIYEGWKPDDATPSNSTMIVDKQYTKNGNTVWNKKLKIDVGDDEPVYWDFYVVTDGKSDKFFVLATYSLQENDPTWAKLYNGIKFL